jgi:hypothetical protein
MAPGYGQYNNYYDPVGSQANQPQPYSYQAAATTASQPTTASYSTPSYPSYGSSSYSTQQHGTSTGGQDNQPSASRSTSAQQNDGGSGSWGNPDYSSSSYDASLQPPARGQSNNSPLYASSAPSASYGRLNYNPPSSQAQSSATTYGQSNYAQQSGAQSYAATGTSDTSRQAYGASQHNPAPTEPSLYAGALQPVQSQAQNHHQSHQQPRQQTHASQPSRSSTHQTSPVMTRAPPQQTDHRQASSSVEPTNTTVDPSQVYDYRAERERKAKIEAEKRRKMEEAEAAKKAEEARVAEEQRKIDEAIQQAEEAKRKAEEQEANEERRRAEQARRKAEEQAAAVKAAAKAEEKRKKKEQRKARESKNAANTLAAMASSSKVTDSNELPPPANDEEAEMRAMFQKMREFNSKNPAMLAKLWEEERRSHAVQSQSPQPSAALETAVHPPKPKSKAPQQNTPTAQISGTKISGTTSTPNQTKPAQKAASTMAGPANQSQGSEANVSQGTTHLWPPGKKALLAEIAARWLQNANPQQPVMTAEVLKRLDMNPNYVQLCKSLEAMGLKFERAAFARELLRGIPPGSNSSQPLTKVSDATIMSANGTVAQATGVAQPDETNPKKRRATKAEMEQRRALNLVKTMNKQNGGSGSSNGMVEYQMPSFTVPGDASNGGYLTHMPEQVQASASPFQAQHASPTFPASDNYNNQQPSQSVQPERGSISAAQQGRPMPVGSAQQTPEVRQMSPPRQPANKEEAARKRGFADLVDLTAGDSDDDAPPVKIMKPTQVQRPNEPFKHQPLQQQQQPAYQYNPKPTNPKVSAGNFQSKPFKTPGMPSTPQLFKQPNGSFGPAPPGPLALANASASGVSTPKPSHKKKGPSNEQLQHERIRGKMVVEPIMRDRVARRSTYDSRTIARDILLATGRHPDMRPLNSHMNVMQKLLGERGGQLDMSGNKSDLATIKWNILDPDPPKKAAPANELPKAPALSVVRSTEIDGEDADDEENGMGHMQGAAHPVQSGAVRDKSGLNGNNANALALATDDKPKPKRGRGRPPRSSLPNFNTENSPMSATPHGTGTPRQATGRLESTSATAPAGRPAALNAPAGMPIGYAAFNKLDENGNVIKTKGRPKGWRKSVHSREAQGLSPKKFQSSGTKAKTPAQRQLQLQEPKYQIYKCRWTDCDAQLHSMDVLKKHVLKVHGKSDEQHQYPCLWRGCADKDEIFDDIPTWLGHVDKEHLQPIAWKLGDGPRGGLSGKFIVYHKEV